MRRVSHDGVVTQSSSISLLQERFRQLKRVKEMREEKELIRDLLSEAEQPAPKKLRRQTAPYEPLNFFFNPELINIPNSTISGTSIDVSSSPTIQLTLSLCPSGSGDNIRRVEQGYSRCKGSSVFGNSRLAVVENRRLFDCCFLEDFGREDVDTSLHL